MQEWLSLLREALNDEDESVRQAASWALDRAEHFARPDKIRSMVQEGDDTGARLAAIDCLAEFEDVGAADLLADTLANDPVAEVRAAAITALAQIGTQSAVRSVEVGLDDEDDFIAAAAAKALGRSGDLRGEGKLLEMLNSESPRRAAAAAEALGAIGSVEAVPGLVAALGNESSEVQRSAARALGAVGGEEAWGPLAAAVEGPDPKVRREAVRALGRLCSRIPLSAGP
ncbi:MAG: HEAT repeat domain-containing protein [Armatimonadota bacterium]|jgi:HEAT repeat protein